MNNDNSTGKPLAGNNWLKIHHEAKLPERTNFAKQLAKLQPKKIVDLGCASGLWLEILNDMLPPNCEFIGIDSDPNSLKVAQTKSEQWSRKTTFLNLDIEKDAKLIPSADLTLAFNIFPYIENLDGFIKILSDREHRGVLVIRQYDGASIRFGPMETIMRQQIEFDLRTCVEKSQRFRHYDLDRTFSALKNTSYSNCEYWFELFARTTPFDKSFIPYYSETLEWTCQNISTHSEKFLRKWIAQDLNLEHKYFYEVDLVALLS